MVFPLCDHGGLTKTNQWYHRPKTSTVSNNNVSTHY